MASIKIDGILRGALRVGASDIHIGSDRSPYFRIEGKLVRVKDAPVLSR